MTATQEPAIAKGSLVLVTGANGFIGSHVAEQFLQAGFRVRGTVRDAAKHAWMANVFDKRYGAGQFELVTVSDLCSQEAFSSAMKDVAAVVHVASNVSMAPEPDKVLPVAIDGALSALKAANAEPGVKRFVLTSSTFAATMPCLSSEKIVTKDTWNDESVRITKEAPRDLPTLGSHIYAASKTLSEQAVWKFCREDPSKRPDLVVNAVLPSATFGKSVDFASQGHASTSSFIADLWAGADMNRIRRVPPHWFVDVQDIARLHVAAAVRPDVDGERIFGCAETYSYDSLLDILRTQNPGQSFIPNFDGTRELAVIEPGARAEQLLRDSGRPGFTPLEESVRLNCEGQHA